MKKILFLIIVLKSLNLFCQEKEFYDFILLKNGDTVYGKYKKDKLIDLRNKKYRIDSTILKIRHNDLIFERFYISLGDFNSKGNDSLIRIDNMDYSSGLITRKPIFYHKIREEIRQDFAVTIKGDTIKGNIKSRNDIAKFKFIDKKLKIKPKNILYFRKDGFEYFFKKKRKINPFDTGKAYLKLVYKGNINLYEYNSISRQAYVGGESEKHFYIEKDEKIYLIPRRRFTKFLLDKLPEYSDKINILKDRGLGANYVFLSIKFIDTDN